MATGHVEEQPCSRNSLHYFRFLIINEFTDYISMIKWDTTLRTPWLRNILLFNIHETLVRSRIPDQLARDGQVVEQLLHADIVPKRLVVMAVVVGGTEG